MMDTQKNLDIQEGNDIEKFEKRDFKEIKPQGTLSVSEARSYFDDLFQEMHDKKRLSGDDALEKALNDPESLANQTDSEEDADEVRELCDDIKNGVNNDDDVIVHDGLYPEYEKMIESGEYEDEEDLCNGEGLNYDDIYDVRSERYGDEYEQGFKDGWNSVDDENHDNEAYNQGMNDAEKLSSLCGKYYSENRHDAGTSEESGEGTETKETRELTDEEKQHLKDTLGWSDKQIAKCTIDEDGVIHYKTDNCELEGKTSETGVPYERKTIEINGVTIEGVFPKFDSAFDTELSPEKYKSKAYATECNKNLKEAIANDPDLKSKFTEEQLKDIEEGRTPTGYVWHHNEETGKMQLVKDTDHRANRHTGGSALWGPDSTDNSKKGENF